MPDMAKCSWLPHLLNIGLILCVCFYSHGQSPSDRKEFKETLLRLNESDTNHINTLYKYGGSFELENDDSARYWYDRAYHLSRKHQYIDGQLRYRSYLSVLLINVGKYDEGMKHVDTAFNLSIRYNRRRFTAIMHNTYGTIWQYKSEIHKAAESYMKAYTMAEAIRDTLLMNGVAGNLSGIFLDIGRYDKAREFSKINHELAVAVRDTLSEGYGLVNLTSCDIHDGKFELARRQSRKAIEIAHQYADEGLELFALANLGHAFQGMNNIDSAMLIWREMHALALKNDISYHLMFAAKGLGESFLAQHKPGEAIAYLEEALVHSRKAENKPRQAEILRSLAAAYEMAGDMARSVAHWKTFHALNDSINIVEQNRNISELEASFQSEKNKRELTEKNLEIEQEKNKATTRLFLLGGMLLLLTVAFIFILQRVKIGRVREDHLRQEMAMKILKAGETERTRIAKDLHDDVGATLSSIHIYSKAAQMHLHEKPEEVPVLISRISENSERMMDKMSDIIWSINSGADDTGENLVLRIKTFAMDILGSKEIESSFQLDVIGQLTFSIAARKNILLIFKECINNIAKYSNARHVAFQCERENGDIIIQIKDDGVGFNTTHAKNGNGLGNMAHRAELLGGALTISSTPGAGSKFTVKIPIARISDANHNLF
jgi:two-component system sensor histidine kinase UhpB